MRKTAFYISIVLSLSGCVISGKPDCNDISITRLQDDLKSFIIQEMYEEKDSKRDSIRALFSEAGFNYKAIIPPENPPPEFDSLKNAFYTAMGRLDTLLQPKLDSINQIKNNIIVNETGKLISESENSSLTTFHCTCQGEFKQSEESANFTYRLTRYDFDSNTYSEVTNVSLPN